MKDERRDDDRENGANGGEPKSMATDPEAIWQDNVAVR